jgi:hypothetical protein
MKDLERKRASRIARSVLRGEQVAEPEDAAAAVDLAHWMMRRRPLIFRLGPVWLAAFLFGPSAWAWLHGHAINETRAAIVAGVFIALPVALELRLIRVRQRIRRSREANLALLAGSVSADGRAAEDADRDG